MPFKQLQPHSKEDDPCDSQDQRWNGSLGKSGSFNKNAPDAIGEHGQREGFDNGYGPIGEVVVTEKDAGENHHRHADHVDEGISDLGFGCMTGQEDTDPGEGDVPGHKEER